MSVSIWLIENARKILFSLYALTVDQYCSLCSPDTFTLSSYPTGMNGSLPVINIASAPKPIKLSMTASFCSSFFINSSLTGHPNPDYTSTEYNYAKSIQCFFDIKEDFNFAP